MMAKIKPDQPLVPSLLDRLLDDEPDLSREAPKSRTVVLRELKQAVRRDLQDLLNTHLRCISFPEHLEELKQSLVNYGLPDFTGASLGGAKDQQEFCRIVQAIIKRFEPRFRTVKVIPVPNAEPLDRTLHFRIDALLYAEPAPEPIVFDSLLRPATGNFEVKGVGE